MPWRMQFSFRFLSKCGGFCRRVLWCCSEVARPFIIDVSYNSGAKSGYFFVKCFWLSVSDLKPEKIIHKFWSIQLRFFPPGSELPAPSVCKNLKYKLRPAIVSYSAQFWYGQVPPIQKNRCKSIWRKSHNYTKTPVLASGRVGGEAAALLKDKKINSLKNIFSRDGVKTYGLEKKDREKGNKSSIL